MTKHDFIVTGMSCASCAAHVDKAARSAKGVTNVNVNLLTGDMRVEGDFDPEEVISKVKSSGYGARSAVKNEGSDSGLKDERIKKISSGAVRLMISALLMSVLFVISMSYGMKMPYFQNADARTVSIVYGIAEAFLALAVIIVNYKIFVNGVKGLVKLAPNMDSLVATGVAASFGYSFAVMISVIVSNDASYRPDYYFESSAMILTFIGIGKLLEEIAKGRARDAVSALRKLVPDTCTVLKDGKETVVPTKEVLTGDTIVLRPGDRIALDCEIVSGSSEIDESTVTGESIPVFKKAGDKAIAGTVNITGIFKAKVTSESGSTTVDRMAELVREIASTKAPIAKVADKVAGIFVPAVMAVALLVFGAWMIAGKGAAFSLARGVSVLVISCPCALGLATPVAIICGSAASAKRGVLFKTSESLELAGRVKTVMFDKTGTITEGQMKVEQAAAYGSHNEEELTEAAAYCESGGTHPIAAAIVSFYGRDLSGEDADREFIPGFGASAALSNGKKFYCGKAGFLPVSVPEAELVSSDFPGTVVYVSNSEEYLGRIVIRDSLSQNAAKCIRDLSTRKIKTVMLTGDNEKAARYVAGLVGIDEVRAGLLPGDKSSAVSELVSKGNAKVAMVGDGINDAPALTAADVGIAIGRGTDIAIESADVVITGSSLTQVSGAIVMAKKTLRIIYENLFWAFGYNMIGIPLAAGLFSLINGSFVLSPAFCSVAMSVSSVLVVSNSLRLLASGNRAFGRIEKSENSIKKESEPCDNLDSCDIIHPEGENVMIKTVIEVKGMMCHNCERHVNNAVGGAFEVISVDSDFEKGETVILSKDKPDEEKLRKVIKEEGYETGRIITL